MINTDHPILDPSNDKLRRMMFAEEIASGLVNSLKDNNESIVIDLIGNKGSGKSTHEYLWNTLYTGNEENNKTFLMKY